MYGLTKIKGFFNGEGRPRGLALPAVVALLAFLWAIVAPAFA